MPTIRKRLLLWLLPGLGLVWAGAGTGVYQTVKRAEIARLDTKLEKLEGAARFMAAFAGRNRDRDQSEGGERAPRPERPAKPERADGPERPEGSERPQSRSRPGPGPEERFPEFFTVDGGAYFQVWTAENEIRTRSESLGDRELPLPPSFGGEQGEYFSTALADGKPLRAYARSFRSGFGRSRGRPGESGRPPAQALQIAIAVDLEPVNQTLASLLFGIIGAGILAALASSALVALALRSGLRPIGQLGERVDAIDASSLNERFPTEEMPAELAPISSRLNELMERLEKGFERERRFSADLAHELRTPVAELRTMAEVALKWPDGNDKEQSEQTLEIATQMGGIIESLLALGRYENGQAEIEPENVSIADLSEAAWKPYAERAAERGVQVRFEVPADQSIRTDAEMLRVVVGNLLSNAAEYTPDGGQIVIEGASKNGSESVLSVSNTTADLDQEAVSHLFERFWRRDGARSDNSHCGLGLSLAQACSRALSLDLGADLNSDNSLTIKVLRNSEETPAASSSDNLAGLS